jgi:hypothetical protein
VDVIDQEHVSTLQLGFTSPSRDQLLELFRWLSAAEDDEERAAAVLLQSKVRGTLAAQRVEILKVQQCTPGATPRDDGT